MCKRFYSTRRLAGCTITWSLSVYAQNSPAFKNCSSLSQDFVFWCYFLCVIKNVLLEINVWQFLSIAWVALQLRKLRFVITNCSYMINYGKQCDMKISYKKWHFDVERFTAPRVFVNFNKTAKRIWTENLAVSRVGVKIKTCAGCALDEILAVLV